MSSGTAPEGSCGPAQQRARRSGRTAADRGWPHEKHAADGGYWLAAAPLLALLPAGLAYRAACWRADLTSRFWPEKRGEVVRNLRQVLGEKLSEQEAERTARDIFRIRSCEVIDLMRLRGRGRALGKLVEIRGREHLDAALAGGKGAILCGAHLGRTIEVPFLGRQARFLPGVVTLGRLTGAPVLMACVHRCADYRHQVLEISPPVPMEGETATAFGRCVAAMDAAITAHPAEWDFWFEPDDLARLALIPGPNRQ